jgi:predicted nuclease with RNAse H fold
MHVRACRNDLRTMLRFELDVVPFTIPTMPRLAARARRGMTLFRHRIA